MRKWEMPKINLLGTPKQVKWATDIITDIYVTVNSNNRRAHELQWPHADRLEEAFDKIIFQLEGSLAQIDKAAVIISCRDRFSPERILNLANKYVNREALK